MQTRKMLSLLTANTHGKQKYEKEWKRHWVTVTRNPDAFFNKTEKVITMKYKGMKKIHQGAYISRYDLRYRMEDGKEKVYEMISRKKNMETEEDLTQGEAEAVVLILHNQEGDKILLNREFRMATGQWVYNFPAGLIDPGETPEESAVRELREETGLELVAITDYMGISYSAVGFSNEKNIALVGIAKGEFGHSTSEEEEIEPGWYTKEQVKELLKNNPFAARTQTYCYLWARADFPLLTRC